MLLLSILILSIIIFIIVIEYRYFKEQRNICQKYPFYNLRDKIIRKIAESDNYNDYLETYDCVNWVIGRLKYFNFNFYSVALSKLFSNILEEAYKRNFQIDEQFLKDLKKSKLGPFDREFICLILETAQSNSFLLKLAMTEFGYTILFSTHFFKAIIKFLKKHPELLKKEQQKGRTIRDYSYMNRLTSHI